MNTFRIITFVAALLFTLAWAWGIRTNVRRGVGITWPTATIVAFWLVSLVVVAITRLSAFHLLWMFPTALVIGLVSIGPGLRFLWWPARLLVRVATLGLNKDELARNSARVERFRTLTAEGVAPEEASRIVAEEFP